MSKEVEIKVPSPGESISEVRIAQWLVENGDVVEKDQPIAEIDSDKATLELTSEEEGKITLLVEPDTEVAVGDVVAKVDTSVKAEKKAKASADKKEAPKKEEAAPKAKEAAPANGQGKAKAPAVEAHATPVAKAVMARARRTRTTPTRATA